MRLCLLDEAKNVKLTGAWRVLKETQMAQNMLPRPRQLLGLPCHGISLIHWTALNIGPDLTSPCTIIYFPMGKYIMFISLAQALTPDLVQLNKVSVSSATL